MVRLGAVDYCGPAGLILLSALPSKTQLTTTTNSFENEMAKPAEVI